MATSKVFKKLIYVINTHHDIAFSFGEDVFPNETPITVQYTTTGGDAEHYESVVAKSFSHTDGEKWERVPAPPLHNKTPSHSRMKVSEMSEQGLRKSKRENVLQPSEPKYKGRAASRIRQTANKEEFRMTVMKPGSVSCAMTR